MPVNRERASQTQWARLSIEQRPHLREPRFSRQWR